MRRKPKPATPPPQPPQQDKVLTVRLDEDLQKRFADAALLVRLDKSTLARICLEAIVDMIEREKHINVPLRVQVAEQGTERL